jgi:hypothetical protein
MIFRQHKGLGCLLVLVSVVVAGWALYFGLKEQLTTTWIVLAFVGSGLAMLGGVLNLRNISPKLTVNADGITDHRNGGRLIAWGDIRQMDCQFTQWRGKVNGGKVVCYVMSGDGRVEDVVIDIGDLDSSPEDVWRDLSKARIEFGGDRPPRQV